MTLHIVHMTSGHEAHDTRIVAKQCAGLAAMGYRVSLVARATQQGGTAPMPPKVTHVPVPRPTGRLGRFIKTAIAVVRQAKKLDPDIYHFHDPELLPHALWLARQGKIVVYDVHEDYRRSIRDRSWLPKPLQWLAQNMIVWLETQMSYYGWVAAATPDIATHFPAEKTALVQNFPSLAEFDSYDQPLPLTQRANRLVYVGAITQERGIADIIAALPQIKSHYADICFDLIGPLTPEYKRQLQTIPGWEAVTCHGRLDRANVVACLHQAKIGLVTLQDVPRYRVSQPTKLYEYMAAGLPVVASNFPYWESQVGSDIGIFVPPDPDNIAQAILTLLSDPKTAAEMGHRGRQKVEQDFSYESDLARLVALYARGQNS